MLHLPKLTVEENKSLVKQITREELHMAIGKLKANKSPGTDGFTAEWYKKLGEPLTPVLLKTFNWLLTKLECSNYRPISVLNVDYKLFTSIIARRLEGSRPNWIC